jgi:hypothetical protein
VASSSTERLEARPDRWDQAGNVSVARDVVINWNG